MMISVTKYKEEFDSNRSDVIVEMMLEAAQAEVENELGYSLEIADYERTYTGSSRLIGLPHKQINSIESLTVDGITITGYVLEGHYIIIPITTTLTKDSVVVVKYNAGWLSDEGDSTETNCPGGIRAAIQLITQAMLSNIGTGGISPQVNYGNQGSIVYSNDPGKWKKYYAFLDPYRIIVM